MRRLVLACFFLNGMNTGATARNARQADFIQYGGLSVSGGDYAVARPS